jgi:hypothetical protein
MVFYLVFAMAGISYSHGDPVNQGRLKLKETPLARI